MTLMERIAEAIASDDCDQSEQLAEVYQSASAEGRDAIDQAFYCVCGWGLSTLIEQGRAE